MQLLQLHILYMENPFLPPSNQHPETHIPLFVAFFSFQIFFAGENKYSCLGIPEYLKINFPIEVMQKINNLS